MRLTGVLDTNGIIGLTKGGVFHLLEDLYASLYVPPAVVREIIIQGQGRPGTDELRQSLGRWIIEITPDPVLTRKFPASLPQADREVLALARERETDHIISSDGELCRQAARHGLTCLGISDLVLLLKDQGAIPAVRPIFDRMRAAGFGIRESAYQEALRSAGELFPSA